MPSRLAPDDLLLRLMIRKIQHSVWGLPQFVVLMIFWAAGFTTAFSSEQVPDRIWIEGKEHYLLTDGAFLSPLEHYLYQRGHRPLWHGVSTNLNRGHVAEWALRGQQLWLTRLCTPGLGDGPYGFSLEPNDLTTIFRRQVRAESVFAEWFSGAILARGEEDWQILWFETGEIWSRVSMDHAAYHAALRELYGRSAEPLSEGALALQAFYDGQISREVLEERRRRPGPHMLGPIVLLAVVVVIVSLKKWFSCSFWKRRGSSSIA